MKSIRLRILSTLLSFCVAGFLGGCAGPSPSQVVLHCITFKADPRLNHVENVTYRYGNEQRLNGMSVGIVRTMIRCVNMPVPEEMQIAWQSLDGTSYQAKVPVRKRLDGPIDRKELVFIFVPDGIEGFIEDSNMHRSIFVHQAATVVKN